MALRFFEGVQHASLYAKFRPSTPSSLMNKVVIGYLKENLPGPWAQAVDVGCGSGQGTRLLSPHFGSVLGTDLSEAQVAQATTANTCPNVKYKVSPAEILDVPDGSCQLITAVQACHWFDLPTFFSAAGAALCPGGVLALIGYRLPLPIHQGRERRDALALIQHFYMERLVPYVTEMSRETYIEAYTAKRFTSPFSDHRRVESEHCDLTATVRDLVGYCSSWSGFQRMVRDRGEPAGEAFLQELSTRLLEVLGDGSTVDTPIVIRFPYFVLLSRKES